MTTPKLIAKAFCTEGLKNEIPETRTSGIAENSVTYHDGFPQITMTPIAAGGKPPSGKDMNGILHEISGHIVHLNKGGMYQFDAAFAEKIGGYPKGAVLISGNLDALFLSLINNNKTNFNSTSYNGKWLKFATPIVNNLTSNTADSALSAAMGKNLSESKLGNSGNQTITNGKLTVGAESEWDKLTCPTVTGNWTLGFNPQSDISNGDTLKAELKYQNGNQSRTINIPATGNSDQTIAYQSWVTERIPAWQVRTFRGDLNTLKSDGIYAIATTSGSTNLPVSDACHVFVIAGTDTSWCRQYAYRAYTDECYTRHQERGRDAWSAWVRVDGVAQHTHSIADITGLQEVLTAAAPPGAIIHFPRRTAPTGWLKANGAAVSRTTYARLFAAIGTTCGAGDGRTTFNLPDVRGEFIRGFDDGRNIDRNRVLGSAQGDAIRNITGSLKAGGDANDSNQQFVDGLITTGVFGKIAGNKSWTADQTGPAGQAWGADFDASRVVPTATENRSRNIALLGCIKI